MIKINDEVLSELICFQKKYMSIYANRYGQILEADSLITAALEELKKYRDLEKQGLLLRLPCKVGSTVYAYCGVLGILSYTVDSVVIDNEITYQCSAHSNLIGDCPSECLDEIEPDISDFGKTVFLTQEEAEEALRNIKESETGK